MSIYFSGRLRSLVPYVPGEQPQKKPYLKLNTNESPFPPPPSVAEAVAAEANRLQLYSDPDSRALVEQLAASKGVKPTQVLVGNGSDEVLSFAFQAFADETHPLCFPDITYGFYPVLAELYRIPYTCIPLREDFTVDPLPYIGCGRTVVLANPNAPTGIALPLETIEKIVRANPETVVLIDEAYVDFGGESAILLTEKYENLLVVQTFSKSRSLAGGRLGFAVGSEKLIADLHTVRNSFNPYNVNRMTAAAGVAALREQAYYDENCRAIIENRAWTTEALHALGFDVLPSQANFLFARSERIGGETLYLELKQRGILVRHFGASRIAAYNRITIGTRVQMERLIDTIKTILEENDP
ncbi:MAG: histidinol-phosphate transaminase [Oscillospiraceae bacterium]|nr:histidinol-phosphate transaminase [Oscillospiraceae bacterium]